MKIYPVKIYPSSAQLPREEQLARKIAGVAADDVPISREVAETIIDRVVDDAAVAIAAINCRPMVAAIPDGEPVQDLYKKRPTASVEAGNGW